MPQAIGEYKECTKCRRVKHIDEFYRDNRTKDGFTYYCRVCRIEETQKSQPTNMRLRQQLTLTETTSNWFKARLPELLDPETLEKVRMALDEELRLDPKWPVPERRTALPNEQPRIPMADRPPIDLDAELAFLRRRAGVPVEDLPTEED
jgi:hypothetical protein